MRMVPQSCAIPVLITRPEPQASRFAQDLQARYGPKVFPVLSPLLAPKMLYPAVPSGPFGSVILTSETGARAAAAMAEALPKRAYCVGDHTAEVATALGFDARSAAGDAAALLKLLLSAREDAPFLHLRGRETRGDIVQRLRDAEVAADEVILYAQEPQPLGSKALEILQGAGPVVAPLFSPRSATVFRQAVSQLPEHVKLSERLCLVALSPAVASAVGGDFARQIVTASAPTQTELFSAMDRFIFIA